MGLFSNFLGSWILILIHIFFKGALLTHPSVDWMGSVFIPRHTYGSCMNNERPAKMERTFWPGLLAFFTGHLFEMWWPSIDPVPPLPPLKEALLFFLSNDLINWPKLIWRKNIGTYLLTYQRGRAFHTPSDFPITKEKWSLGHMDEISEVGLLLSRLNLTINWSKVWPKFEFEFSLPLPWLVNSKIFRNYF